MRYVMLSARQQACERINKMFGLNVWVDFKKPYMEELREKEMESEILYNDAEYDEMEDWILISVLIN